MIAEDLTPQQRAARVTWMLVQHGRLTTAELRDVTGITDMGVYFLMGNLSVVLPIWKPKVGVYALLTEDDYEAADG